MRTDLSNMNQDIFFNPYNINQINIFSKSDLFFDRFTISWIVVMYNEL